VSLLWLIGEVGDPVEAMAWDVVSHILIGTLAAPLRKALIDSGLGDELIASGLGTQQLEWVFGIGLKGISIGDAEQVETLVFQTLERLSSEALDPNLVEAALNTLEFALRERNTGAFPRGIALMMSALRRWLYGGDPMESLAFEAPLTALKARLATGEQLLEGMIDKHLVIIRIGHPAPAARRAWR
jgi:Zn-dependent M16 (insulinase) family peptidase